MRTAGAVEGDEREEELNEGEEKFENFERISKFIIFKFVRSGIEWNMNEWKELKEEGRSCL